MKFKIKHRTPCFEWGIRIPWFVAPVLLIAAVYRSARYPYLNWRNET